MLYKNLKTDTDTYRVSYYENIARQWKKNSSEKDFIHEQRMQRVNITMVIDTGGGKSDDGGGGFAKVVEEVMVVGSGVLARGGWAAVGRPRGDQGIASGVRG